jgi:hypothetical protein
LHDWIAVERIMDQSCIFSEAKRKVLTDWYKVETAPVRGLLHPGIAARLDTSDEVIPPAMGIQAHGIWPTYVYLGLAMGCDPQTIEEGKYLHRVYPVTDAVEVLTAVAIAWYRARVPNPIVGLTGGGGIAQDHPPTKLNWFEYESRLTHVSSQDMPKPARAMQG